LEHTPSCTIGRDMSTSGTHGNILAQETTMHVAGRVRDGAESAADIVALAIEIPDGKFHRLDHSREDRMVYEMLHSKRSLKRLDGHSHSSLSQMNA